MFAEQWLKLSEIVQGVTVNITAQDPVRERTGKFTGNTVRIWSKGQIR